MNKMDQHKQFWGRVEIPFRKSETEAWDELQARVESGRSPVIRMQQRRMPWIAAAAAVVIALGVYFFTSGDDMVTVAMESGNTGTFVLPDGSEVILNADGQLSYASDWSESRTVKLNGHAFFNVQKGSTFTVSTPQGDVQVLGTSFDVFARNARFEVYCKTGRVKVKSGNEQQIIVPGELAILDNGQLKKTAGSDGVTEWINGRFVYENQSLDEVLNEIERQFSIEIDRPSVHSVSYTGEFENSNLEEALNVVLSPFGMDYKKLSDRRIEIKTTRD